MNKKGILRIGTSNVVVPGNKQSFPETFRSKSRLNFYASLFNTVEINGTFYKIPMASTFEKWSADVPEDFQFSLKLWREITHVKELKFRQGDVDLLMQPAANIGARKGCLLLQFPGKITLEYFAKVDEILHMLAAGGYLDQWRCAVEFRNASWYAGETMELLDQYNASLVIQDIPKSKNERLNKQARFAYLRFHGEKGDYRGSYPDAFLQEKAHQIEAWLNQGMDVYVYFNNTMGSAFENAMTLKRLFLHAQAG